MLIINTYITVIIVIIQKTELFSKIKNLLCCLDMCRQKSKNCMLVWTKSLVDKSKALVHVQMLGF